MRVVRFSQAGLIAVSLLSHRSRASASLADRPTPGHTHTAPNPAIPSVRIGGQLDLVEPLEIGSSSGTSKGPDPSSLLIEEHKSGSAVVGGILLDREAVSRSA